MTQQSVLKAATQEPEASAFVYHPDTEAWQRSRTMGHTEMIRHAISSTPELQKRAGVLYGKQADTKKIDAVADEFVRGYWLPDSRMIAFYPVWSKGQDTHPPERFVRKIEKKLGKPDDEVLIEGVKALPPYPKTLEDVWELGGLDKGAVRWVYHPGTRTFTTRPDKNCEEHAAVIFHAMLQSPKLKERADELNSPDHSVVQACIEEWVRGWWFPKFKFLVSYPMTRDKRIIQMPRGYMRLFAQKLHAKPEYELVLGENPRNLRMREAEEPGGDEPANPSLAKKLASSMLKNKAMLALPFRQLWRHKYVEHNYDADQAWKLFYWPITHDGAGGKGYNPETRKAAAKIMVSAFTKWAKPGMKTKVKRADGEQEMSVGDISREEFIRWFGGGKVTEAEYKVGDKVLIGEPVVTPSGYEIPAGEIVGIHAQTGKFIVKLPDSNLGQLRTAAEIDADIKRSKSNAEFRLEQKKKQAAQDADAAKRDDMHGFLESLSSALLRGRAKAYLLDRQIRWRGNVYRRKEFVEALHKDGFEPNEKGFKWKYGAFKPDGGRIDLDQTAYAYLSYLRDKKVKLHEADDDAEKDDFKAKAEAAIAKAQEKATAEGKPYYVYYEDGFKITDQSPTEDEDLFIEVDPEGELDFVEEEPDDGTTDEPDDDDDATNEPEDDEEPEDDSEETPDDLQEPEDEEPDDESPADFQEPEEPEQSDGEREMEEFGFTADDVQTFYDIAYVATNSRDEAAKRTKKKFKLKQLEVNPTGIVTVPGMQLPKHSKPAAPIKGRQARTVRAPVPPRAPVAPAGESLDEAEEYDPRLRPSVDPGALSPSGKVSKASRAAMLKREGEQLFPAGYFAEKPKESDTEKANALLRRASQLRELAARGMGTRKHVKQAEKWEAEAKKMLGK